MPDIELIYDDDCPNVPSARLVLKQACERVGLEAVWHEWERSAPDAPVHTRAFGSPTVLVDGADVAGTGTTGDAQSCRVYHTSDGGLQGVPDVETLVEALQGKRKTKNHALSWLSAIGAIVAGGGALLPVLSCPACWPAYAGLLSALGIGFINYTPYLGPVLVGLVCVSLAGLLPGACRRRDIAPVIVGVVGAALLLAGHVGAGNTWLTWGGIGGLVVASLWNGLSERRGARMYCVPPDGISAR